MTTHGCSQSRAWAGRLWLGIAGFVALSMHDAAKADCSPVREGLDIPNGQVYAMTVVGDTLYFGGYFSHVGPACGGWLPVIEQSGNPPPSFPRVAGTVNAVAPDGTGGWYIGGDFSLVGRESLRNLAHVLADGTVAGSNWDPDLPVRVLASNGSLLFVGGDFSVVSGVSRHHLAAIRLDTDELAEFDVPQPRAVTALEAADSVVYIGRDDGLEARRVPAGALAWNDATAYLIESLDLYAGTLFVGGDFVRMQGKTRNHLASLEATTGTLSTWDPGSDGTVHVIHVANGVCYVGGSFSELGSLMRVNVGAVDLMSGFATGWAPYVGGSVYGLTTTSSSVMVVGNFSSVDGQPRLRFASFHPLSGVLDALALDLNDTARAIAEDGGNACIGGSFTAYRVVARRNAAAIDLTTGRVTAWKPDPDNSVYTLAGHGATLYLGGYFSVVGGAARRYLASVDAVTGAATPWNPAANNAIYAIAVRSPNVYCGGVFSTIGGASRARLAAFDLETGALTSWNPGSNSTVNALVARDSTILACGAFFYIGGLNRYGIAELSLGTGAATAFEPPVQPDQIRCMQVIGQRVFVGGDFTRLGTTPRLFIGALDADTGQLLDWNPGMSGYPYAMASQGGLLYVGGSYNTIGSATHWFLAAVDVSTGVPDTWSADADSPINAIAVAGTRLFVAGGFSRIGCGAQACIAELEPPSSLLAAHVGHRPSGGLSGYPNPAVEGVHLAFTLTRPEAVRVGLYDVNGRRLLEYSTQRSLPSGRQELSLDTRGIPPGVYLCRIASASISGEWLFSLLR